MNSQRNAGDASDEDVPAPSTDATPSDAAAAVSIAQLLDELRPSAWEAAAPSPVGCERLKLYQRRALAWMEWRECQLDRLVPSAAWRPELPGVFLQTAPPTSNSSSGSSSSSSSSSSTTSAAAGGRVDAHAHQSAPSAQEHPFTVWRETSTNSVVVVGPGCLPAPPCSYDVSGGILADEMGLGKTAEVIAHIRRRAPPHRESISRCVGAARDGSLWPFNNANVLLASQAPTCVQPSNQEHDAPIQAGAAHVQPGPAAVQGGSAESIAAGPALPGSGSSANAASSASGYGISIGQRLVFHEAADAADHGDAGRVLVANGTMPAAATGASPPPQPSKIVAKHFATVAKFISGELGKDAAAPGVDLALSNGEMALLRSSATLVCLPSRLVPQWLGELSTWGGPEGLCVVRSHPGRGESVVSVVGRAADAVQDPLRVYVYGGRMAGGRRGKASMRHTQVAQLAAMASADVILVDYAVMRRERHMKHGHNVSPLRLFGYWRGVLDEAQEVEGSSVTATAMMAGDIHAVHRWCVTGTPILRSLDDLQGLFRFLCHQPLGQDEYWKALVQPLVASDAPSAQDLAAIRSVLAPLFWRNTKSAVEAELDLPARHVYNISVELGAAERDWYSATAVEVRTRVMAAAAEQTGSLDASIENMPPALRADLASLRRVCCHPGLSDRMQVAAGGVLSEEVQQEARRQKRKRGRGGRSAASGSAADGAGGAAAAAAGGSAASVVASSPDELMHKQMTAFISDTVQPAQARVMDLHMILAQWHWLTALLLAQSTVARGASHDTTAVCHSVQAETHARMGWGASQHVELWREQHSIERLMYRAYAVRESRFILLLLRMFRSLGRREAAAAAAERWKQTSLHTILRYAKQHCAAVRANSENGARFLQERLHTIVHPALHHPQFITSLFPTVMDALSVPIACSERLDSTIEVEVSDAVIEGSGITSAPGTVTLQLRDLVLHDPALLPCPPLPGAVLQEAAELERFAKHMGNAVYHMQAWAEVSELLAVVQRGVQAAKLELGQGPFAVHRAMRKQLRTATADRKKRNCAVYALRQNASDEIVVASCTGGFEVWDKHRDASAGVSAQTVLRILQRNLTGPKSENLIEWKKIYEQQLQSACARAGLDFEVCTGIERPAHGRQSSMAERVTAWVQQYGAYADLGKGGSTDEYLRALRSGEVVFEHGRLVRGPAGSVASLPPPPHEMCLRWPFCVIGHPSCLPFLVQSDIRTDLSNLENSCGLVRDYAVTVQNAEAGLQSLTKRTADFLGEVFDEEPFQVVQSLANCSLPLQHPGSGSISCAVAVAAPFSGLAGELSWAIRESNAHPVARKRAVADDSRNIERVLEGWSRSLYMACGDGFTAAPSATAAAPDAQAQSQAQAGDSLQTSSASAAAPVAPAAFPPTDVIDISEDAEHTSSAASTPVPNSASTGEMWIPRSGGGSVPAVFSQHTWAAWSASQNSMQKEHEDDKLASSICKVLHSQLATGHPPVDALAVIDRETSRADTWTDAAIRAISAQQARLQMASSSGQAGNDRSGSAFVQSDAAHTLIDQFERWDDWTPDCDEECGLQRALQSDATLAQLIKAVHDALQQTPHAAPQGLLQLPLVERVAADIAGQAVPTPHNDTNLNPILAAHPLALEGNDDVEGEHSRPWIWASLAVAGLAAAIAMQHQLVAVRAANTKLAFLSQKADLMKTGFSCTICARNWRWNKTGADGAPEETPPAPALLPCGHVYCYGCLQHWAEVQARARSRDGAPANEGVVSCPECRLSVPKQQWFTFKPGSAGLGAEAVLAYIPYQSLPASDGREGAASVNPLTPSPCLIEHGRVVHEGQAAPSSASAAAPAAAVSAAAAALYTPVAVDAVNSIRTGSVIARFGTKLVTILRRIQSLPPSDKVLIFTQWRSLIPLLRGMLDMADIKNVALEGSPKQKQNAVNNFKKNAAMRVLLLCSDADASGLTLIAARHVMLVDPCDLPGTEEQCVNRVHRLGQHATCFVYRFVAQNTIEELVYQQQQVARYGPAVLPELPGMTVSQSSHDDDERGGANQGGGGEHDDAVPASPSKRRRTLDARPVGPVHGGVQSGGGLADTHSSLLLLPGRRRSLDAAIAQRFNRKTKGGHKRAREECGGASTPASPAASAAGARGAAGELNNLSESAEDATASIDTWSFLIQSLNAGHTS